MKSLLSHPYVATLIDNLSDILSHPLLLLLLSGAGTLILIYIRWIAKRAETKRLADIEEWARFREMAPHSLISQLLQLDAWSGFPRATLYTLDHLHQSYPDNRTMFHNEKLKVKASSLLKAADAFNKEASRLCIDVGGVFRTRPQRYFEDQEERFEKEAESVQELASKVGGELGELYAVAKRELLI